MCAKIPRKFQDCYCILLDYPRISWYFLGFWWFVLLDATKIPRKFIERILGSCKRFLGIRSTSRDSDEMFCKNSQEFMDFNACVRKFLGNSRIVIASCWIILGFPGTFWDFDDLFCWMLQKFLGICGKFIERILGSCKRFLGIGSTSRDYYEMFCKNSQEFMDF